MPASTPLAIIAPATIQSAAIPLAGISVQAVSVGQVTNLAVSLVNDTGVLTWDAVSGADGYKVERTLTGAGSWSEIDDVATTTATDTYTASDTGYDYRVRAYIGAVNGAYSSTVTAYSPAVWDKFNRTATLDGSSAVIGGTWARGITHIVGSPAAITTFTTSGGQARNSSTANVDNSGRIDSGLADVTVQSTMMYGNATISGYAMAVSIRNDASTDNGWAGLITGSSMFIFKDTGGTLSNITSHAFTAGALDNKTLTLTMTGNGTSIEFNVTDGGAIDQTISTTSSDFLTNTYVGLSLRNRTNTTAMYFNKFLARRL